MDKKIKAAAFDLEGTIVDVEYAHHEGYRQAGIEAGLRDMPFKEFVQTIPNLVGGKDETISKEIAELAGKNKDWKFISERKKQHYDQLLKKMDIKPRPGFLKVLEWFRKNGFATIIGTATYTPYAKLLLERSGLNGVFKREKIIFAEDVANVKPAPDVWYKTAEKMNVAPKEQIIFEDSTRGLASVKAAGATAIAMPVYSMPKVIQPLIESGAVRIFMDWREMNIAALIQNLNRT